MGVAPAPTMLLEGLESSDHADWHEVQASVQHEPPALTPSPEWHYPAQHELAIVPAYQEHGLHHRRCRFEGASQGALKSVGANH